MNIKLYKHLQLTYSNENITTPNQAPALLIKNQTSSLIYKEKRNTVDPLDTIDLPTTRAKTKRPLCYLEAIFTNHISTNLFITIIKKKNIRHQTQTRKINPLNHQKPQFRSC